MKASAFDEIAFFRAVQESGARALLIGRRALVLLGVPVLTADIRLLKLLGGVSYTRWTRLASR